MCLDRHGFRLYIFVIIMDKDKRIKELEEMAKVSLTGEEISNLLDVLKMRQKFS